MARSTINALKAIEQRRKKEEEIRNTNSQTANTNKSSNQTTNTNKSSAVTSSGKETKTTLSTQNALNAIRKRREAESRANYSSTPSSKKYTDYNTETKNAYTSAKNKVNTKFTTKSNLSESEREARIKEIESEARNLHTQLSGIGRAKAYGASEALLKKEQEIKNRITELSQEKKTLERTGTFSASELKQFEIDDAKAKKAALLTYNPTARVAPSGVEAYKKNVSDHYALDKEIETIEREKALYDDIAKFGDVTNKDNFSGQWRANYRNNELTREADKAMSEYIMNPTEENKQIAYAYDAFAKEYAKNNEKALDDENVKASWLTKSMAGYLPQFKDQIVPELVGGGIGLLAGSAVGAPNVGMSVGAGLGTYSQTYDVMRGSVYRALLAEGVDEEVALKAAEDEALISSLIESGETALSWLLSGGGKAISAISGAAKASVAKGSTNAATKFVADLATKGLNKTATNAAKAVTQPLWKTGLRTVGGIVGNAATEYLEEFTQGAVSEANRERALSGTPVGGKGQLVKGAGKVVSDAVTGKNPEVLAELHGQGMEGFKIGLMFGGSQTITNNIVSHYVNAKTVKQQNDVADTIINDEETLNALIEEGKASGEGTVSEKIATEIETARANGKEVTREQVKKLIASNEVYIQSEEQTAEPDPLEQTAREVVNERNRTSTPLHETLEALTQNNEPITTEDAKKATGFGDKGAELVSNISNTDGATFYQTVAEVKPSYLAGFNNPDLDIKKVAHTFNSQAQEDAYTAGQMDGKIKALSAKENVKNVVVQKESGFVVENLPNDTQNAASPKNVRTKKSEWSAHDIEWNIPGKKNPIAFSTRATSDLIDMLATDNPAATISELKDIINYDEEAKKVMQQYINAGYGKQIANEWFSTDKERLHNNVIDKFEEESSQTSTRNFEIDNFIENVSEGVTKETKYKHLYNEETVSKEFLDSVNPEVESAILNIRNGNLKAVPDTIEVTKLSDGAIKAISDFVGFDVNGYVCKIEKDSLQHIERRHGVNGKHDQSMSDPKDLARMGYVINNIDNIEWVIDKKGNITLSKKYNNSDNSLCPVMQISARIDGTYCVSQVVPDTRRKTIWISSARIEKADGGNQVPNGNNVTPQRTSETPLDSSSAINNLSQKKDNVKTLKKEKALENNGDIDKFEDNKSISKLEEHENVENLAMWTTKRVGEKVKTKSVSEIVATIEHEFGVNITTGHISGKGVLGQFDKDSRGIRTKIANNLPIISHELGHYFERTLDIKEQLSEELEQELTLNLDERTVKNYPENKLIREGVAEYVRRFLQNRETTAIDYPLFTDFFLKQFTGKDLAILEQLADDINAYYSLDADTATSSIKLAEEGTIDLRTPMEKLKEKASSLYQAFYDSNHAIKRFDRATGSNAYILASNAAYSDAIAGQIVTGDLTDINGQYVSSGLKTVLHGLDLNNKEEYRLFGEYLTVKHGPERLQEGKRVYADDKKNNTNFMERRQAELEAQYPQFEEISERLYTFIRKFYQTWAVDTGLLPEETLEFLNERWEYYVPFNRVMEKGKDRSGSKKGFANQNNTLNRTKKDGSGRDIKHPVDNLINNIVRMVNAGVRNNVMLNITNSAEKLGADATFLEPVPMPLSVTKVDMTGVKDILTTWLEESDMDADSKDKASGIVNNFDDILLQYGRGKAYGNVVTVLKNGNPQSWKINDIELLQSLTNLSPKTMDGILDAYAVLSRFMTSNITGNNLVWSIFSNLPRDIGTFFTYSKNKNVFKMAKGVGSAYLNKAKGDSANPIYKEFLAMGGGKTSAYTSDRNLAKDVRKKVSGRKFNPNPLDWIGFVSDTIESGPRFATYKMMREVGMTPQEAFYEAMDITVNFRRGGRISKELNKVVPFFNANMQGLDKFYRWITAEEVKGADRKKAIRNRAISFVAVSAALAALSYGINNSDDEKDEDYEQLSTYIKNSYWVFPVGDGKYFAVPKPREIAVLSSFFETCMEYGIGENDHAFDEFYAYASENFLPAIANDIAQVGTKGLVETGMNVMGSFGMIGVVGYLGANRDFLGRPIVSSSLQNLEKKDQYTDRTSKMAYWLGQAFNGSPEQIDYFFQQILGGWWKGQKALFPVGEKNVDWSLGVGNTYIKDNQYSTDLTNWLYDRADTTAKSKKSNPDNIDKAITAKWDSNMVDFYQTYYKKAKADSKSTSARSTRQLVLDMIREYQKGIDGDYKTSLQEAVEQVCETKGSTDYLPSVMSGDVTDGNGKKHSLSDVQYVEYQTDYLRLYWETVEETMTANMTTAEKTNILTAAKRVAQEQATERTLKRIGAPSSEFATKYKDVENGTLTEFLAGVSEANDDNSIKKEEVANVISGLDVNNDDAWTLYLSKYDSKTALEAEKHGVDAKLFMTAVVDMSTIKADYKSNGKVISGSRRAKIEKYLNSVCNNYKEYLFLLGTEYDSVKDDSDYISYFGKK